MEDSKSTSNPSISVANPVDPTQVDLGDDLIEKTAPIDGPVPRKPSTFDPADEAESARILLNEGLVDDAKKKLRNILIRDPKNIVACKMLQGIQENEIKHLLSGKSSVLSGYRREADTTSNFDSERVLKDLDHELGLGIFVGELSDPSAARDLDAGIEKLSRDGDSKWRIDLGIALMEMGLFRNAVALFDLAARAGDDLDTKIAATCLATHARIASGDPASAMIYAEPIVRDLDISNERKIELFYLMGRACEILKKSQKARFWYRKVKEFDPAYRDVDERLSRS